MDVEWNAPGPGQWAMDRSHMPAGTTPIVQHLVTTSMPNGMRRMFRELGVPLETIDARFVNGQFYSRLRPLIGADKPSAKVPPVVVLKVAARLHPEMRRRNRTAGRTLVEQPWLKVIDDWHHGGKADIEAANRALQSVDLGSATDAEVIGHVHRCLDHCVTNWTHHFWLHGYDLGPIGRYIYEAQDWGVAPPELLSLLEGASPSTSEPTRERATIRAAIEATGRTPSSLDEMRSLSPEIARLLDEHLDRRGSVLFSRYDVDGVTFGERPDLVLASILNAEYVDRSD